MEKGKPEPKQIIFTVTNDLNFDQRMIRICNSLITAGYVVTLIGTSFNNSAPLQTKSYQQHRINLLFRKGPGFYIEYNIKLFFLLLFKKADCFCAIDMDTILPVFSVSGLRGKIRVYDAHEYFSQMKEVILRPRVYKIWHNLEKYLIPKILSGYTVSRSITAEFEKLYKVKYETIRNLPYIKNQTTDKVKEKNIVYQGAVNESRGFEYLIPAMRCVDANLHIYGDGNFLEQTKDFIKHYGLENKVILKGKLLPDELAKVTAEAYIGINLVENSGLSQYYSLANKFFDYIQYSVPQVTMNFPEYKRINDEYKIGVLINELGVAEVADAINLLLENMKLYGELKKNCIPAAQELNWEAEEKKLIAFYKNIFE